jgi:hypothetical protein
MPCLDFFARFEYSIHTLLTDPRKARGTGAHGVGTPGRIGLTESHHQRSVKHVRKTFFLLIIAALAGCEENPSSVADLTGSSPVLEAMSVAPSAFNLNALQPVGTTYRLSTTLSAFVSDPQGITDVREVRWNLYAPSGTAAIASGTLPGGVLSAGGRVREYAAVITFDATRASAGSYRVELFATDAAGFLSAATSTTLNVRIGDSAPILALAGARQISTSGDSALFSLTVFATDSNGLADVAHVSVRALSSRDSSAQTLYDDGTRTHGDAVAGDGIFSGYRWVRPTTVIPAIVFEYRASDGTGMQSNLLLRPANNEAPRFVSMNVPATITRPGSGSIPISFFVGVNDPNGRSDVDSVYFINQSSTSPSVILMYDDGDLTTHGDSVAADGTWSRRLSIDATTSAGAKTFRFSATDRAGARTDSTRIITIN